MLCTRTSVLLSPHTCQIILIKTVTSASFMYTVFQQHKQNGNRCFNFTIKYLQIKYLQTILWSVQMCAHKFSFQTSTAYLRTRKPLTSKYKQHIQFSTLPLFACNHFVLYSVIQSHQIMEQFPSSWIYISHFKQAIVIPIKASANVSTHTLLL
jgi:hypothetical protein